ncbi:MAG: TnsA endonuclease N-terminal domain-containing protein [Chloroflexota bacterium]
MKIPDSRIPKQIPGYKYGYFPSWKMKKSLVHQTGLEADTIEWLDFRKDISVIVSHPDINLPYVLEGKGHVYEPDLFCVGSNSWFLGECKASKYINTAKNQAKIQAGIKWCHNHGGDFYVFTDKELYKDYLVKNLRILRRYSRYKIDKQLLELIIRRLAPLSNGMPLWAIAEEIDPKNPRSVSPQIHAMIYHHYLYTDLRTQKLNIEAVISVVSNKKVKQNA